MHARILSGDYERFVPLALVKSLQVAIKTAACAMSYKLRFLVAKCHYG
jgi:hypothetical protein